MASLDDLITVGNSVNKNMSQLILAINEFFDLYNSVISVAHGGTGNSSLTANSVLTGNGTNPIVAEPLFVCTDAGNVGIGTASPSCPVDVKGTWVSGTGIIRINANIGTQYSGLTLQNNGTVKTYLYHDNTNSYTWLGTAPSEPLVFSTNDTERMRVNAGAPILCLSGGSTSATGTGIAFPAAQSASSDANTLDDYEESTWTVNFYDAGTGGNVSATTATGYYTKIGRQVTATFLVNNISTAGMTAGNIFYFSLPFTAANIPFTGSAFADTLNYATGTQLNSYVNFSTRGSLITSGDNIAFANILVSAVASGSTDLYVTITYFV